MGRLNASDSSSSSSSSSSDGGGKRSAVVVDDDTNTSDNKNTATTTLNNSNVDVQGSDYADNNNQAVTTDRGVESNKHEQDATLKHSTTLLTSPISLERTTSVVSVSSSSVVTNPIVQSSNNTTSGVVANKISSSTAKPAVAAAASMNNESSSSSSSFNNGNKNNNIVTSLDWKSSNEPILLATCGTNVCIWDLNVVASGSSRSGRSAAAGIRPNLRFAPPNDELYHPGSYLIHCAYSSQQCDDDYDDESKDEKEEEEEEARKHTFATLDNLGVVRIWDDRKAGNCPLHSFVACPGGGVGIASLSPCKSSRLRWVTWGMDDNDDDLVVKVWTESSSSTSPSTTKSRANTSETATASTDANTSDQPRAYNMTSRFAVAGAVAARVHPSFDDGILVFRSNSNDSLEDEARKVDGPELQGSSTFFGGVTTTPTSAGEVEGGVNVPEGLRMRTTPEMAAVVPTPPSPPPLMLEEPVRDNTKDQGGEVIPSSSHCCGGWGAELWRIDTSEGGEGTTNADTGIGREGRKSVTTFGAKRIATFQGGGVEEDSLNFAPGRGDASNVIAVDLAVGTLLDNVNVNNVTSEELSVCVLTEAGRLTVYGVPEASELVEEMPVETSPSKRDRADIESNVMPNPRVYRQGTDHHASQWWDRNEEDDLFGEQETTLHDSPKKSSTMEGMRSALVEDPKPMPPHMPAIADEAAPSVIPDTDSMEVIESQHVETNDVQSNAPIDPTMAARVPCPPLCGVAFSGVGGIVTFNNGPVKRMWSYYQSNELMSPTGTSNQSHMKEGGINVISSDGDEEEDSSIRNEDLDEKSRNLPRTLADLVDMNLRSQTLQWGDGGDNEQQPDSDDGGSSSSGSSGGSSSYEMLDLDDDSNDDDSEEDLIGGFDVFASQKALLGAKEEVNFAGLPSLSPSVLITNKHDDILLNGQTPQLANMLMLGDTWWLNKDFEEEVSDATWRNGEKQLEGVPRSSSDPCLSDPTSGDTRRLAPSTSSSPTRLSTSMMGNLKRLFANQLPSAMTPPDQQMSKSFWFQ